MTHEHRNETADERADRNWEELLGELRVTETGVAILFSVLLTVPFSARFGDVDSFQRTVYVVALLLSAATTVVLVGPVAYHRVLFSTGQKPGIVRHANRLTLAGLVLLVLTLGAVLLLVLDVLLSRPLALITGIGFAAGTAALWFVPALLRRKDC